MSASLHPALIAQIDEVMAAHERRALTQAEIDVPHPPFGGGLVYGAEDRPIAIPWRRIGAWLAIAGGILAAASVGFLAGVALGILWEAVAR